MYCPIGIWTMRRIEAVGWRQISLAGFTSAVSGMLLKPNENSGYRPAGGTILVAG
jgi:hypothetical protein